MKPEIEADGAAGGDPNMVALLSLKLLLLGFFILLNALSQFEENRTRQVLDSVNEAFNGRVQALRSQSSDPAALAALPEQAKLLGTVDRLFNSFIPATRSETAKDGRRLRLELSAESVFRPGRLDLQPSRGLLLERLAGALTGHGRAGLHYELEVLHGAPAGGGIALAEAGVESLEVRRTSVLVRDLIERGVPAERLSVGIVPGRPGKLRFVVRIYEGPRRAPDYRDLAP